MVSPFTLDCEHPNNVSASVVAYNTDAASMLAYAAQLIPLSADFFLSERSIVARLLKTPHLALGGSAPFRLKYIGLVPFVSSVVLNLTALIRAVSALCLIGSSGSFSLGRLSVTPTLLLMQRVGGL